VASRVLCECKAGFEIWYSRSGVWQPPTGRSHAHIAERDQEPGTHTGHFNSRILGKGSYTKMSNIYTYIFYFTTTQLALLVQLERLQVVCSNKEARKRLTESSSTPAMDREHINVVLKRCICMLIVH